MQQPPYQNGYYAQPNYAKPKSGCLKWFLIVGIPTFLIGAAAIALLLIGLIFPSYDIDDYDQVVKATKKVFKTNMVENTSLPSTMKEAGIVSYSGAMAEGANYDVAIRWMEFSSDDKAEAYFDEYVADLVEEFNEEKGDYEDTDLDRSSNVVEAYLGEDGYIEKIILIYEDDCCMFISMEGKKDVVQDLSDDYLDALD